MKILAFASSDALAWTAIIQAGAMVALVVFLMVLMSRERK